MEQYREQMANHMDLMFRPMDIVSSARDRLTDFLRERLGDTADLEGIVSELLAGQWNASIEANVALWDVAQLARKSPVVEQAVETGDPTTLLERLRTVEGGTAVSHELEAWLEHFGRRGGDYSELREPTWNEDPTPVAMILRGYLRREDPRIAITRAEARKQTVIAEFRPRLQQPDRDAFDKLLVGVKDYLPIKESRNSVMSLSRASLRAPALAAGRKLVAFGAINEVDDVFFLTFSEIEAAAGGTIDGLDALIGQRRAEYELWRDIVPPATIGGQASDTSAAEDQIKGVAASRGKVRGRARVILHLSDGDQLQPGEILVTRSTTSAWTPLFLNAAGIVTDSGGMLSHCAVVAREYQLPAVVGTYTATRLIADGDLLEVDGSSGLVLIERD
jgi:pyruvate,water dikinase